MRVFKRPSLKKIFAWTPVKMENGKWVWFDYVYEKRCVTIHLCEFLISDETYHTDAEALVIRLREGL